MTPQLSFSVNETSKCPTCATPLPNIDDYSNGQVNLTQSTYRDNKTHGLNITVSDGSPDNEATTPSSRNEPKRLSIDRYALYERDEKSPNFSPIAAIAAKVELAKSKFRRAIGKKKKEGPIRDLGIDLGNDMVDIVESVEEPFTTYSNEIKNNDKVKDDAQENSIVDVDIKSHIIISDTVDGLSSAMNDINMNVAIDSDVTGSIIYDSRGSNTTADDKSILADLTAENDQQNVNLSQISQFLSHFIPSGSYKLDPPFNDSDEIFCAQKRDVPRTVIGPTPSKGVKEGEAIWDDDILDPFKADEEDHNSDMSTSETTIDVEISLREVDTKRKETDTLESEEDLLMRSQLNDSNHIKINNYTKFLQSNSRSVDSVELLEPIEVATESSDESEDVSTSKSKCNKIDVIFFDGDVFESKEEEEHLMEDGHCNLALCLIDEGKGVGQENYKLEDIDEGSTTTTREVIDLDIDIDIPTEAVLSHSSYQICLQSKADPIDRGDSDVLAMNLTHCEEEKFDMLDTNPHSPTDFSWISQPPESITSVKNLSSCKDDDFSLTPPPTPTPSYTPISSSSAHPKSQKDMSTTPFLSLIYFLFYSYMLLIFVCTVHSLSLWYETGYPEDGFSVSGLKTSGLKTPWIGVHNATRLINQRYVYLCKYIFITLLHPHLYSVIIHSYP